MLSTFKRGAGVFGLAIAAPIIFLVLCICELIFVSGKQIVVTRFRVNSRRSNIEISTTSGGSATVATVGDDDIHFDLCNRALRCVFVEPTARNSNRRCHQLAGGEHRSEIFGLVFCCSILFNDCWIQ